MVHGFELFFSLFNNLAIFIALVAIYRYGVGQFGQASGLRRQAVMGLAFGLFAVGCMYARIPVFKGVLVDQRNAVVTLSGVFGGPLSAAISAVFAGSYRAYLGGDGVLGGVIGVCLAAVAGSVLHARKGSFSSLGRAAAHSLFATVFILPGFLFIGDLQAGLGLLRAMALPYGFALFCGIFFVGLLLNREEERFAIEQSFLESERRYRTLFEVAQDTILVVKDGRLADCNRSAEALLGRPREEIIGRYPAELSPRLQADGRESARLQDQVHADSAAGKPLLFDWTFLRPDGTPVEVEVSLQSLGEESPGLLLGMARDVTARRRAEQQLRQSEDKFSRLFRLSPDSIVLVDLETGRLADVNETFLQVTGYAREEVLGRTEAELDLMMDPERLRTLEAAILREGRVENFEFEGQAKDGRVAICSMSALAMDIDGRPHRISMVRDITEIKRMQEMMVQTEKMISVGGIAAGIAHEINNPLGIVLQAAQNLVRRLDPGLPKNREAAGEIGLDLDLMGRYIRARGLDTFLEDIRTAAVRAAGIIRHMLDFSRRSESRRTTCDLAGIMRKALDLARSDYDLKKSYDFKKIQVDLEADGALPEVRCTETEIEQVFLNLLRNAAQAMAGAEPPVEGPRIGIRLTPLPDAVRVTVEDNGPGIPPAVQRRIFEPFFTTKAPGVGTGLGLSVSYFIVTQGHGGRMAVESAPGKGARFILELPSVASRP